MAPGLLPENYRVQSLREVNLVGATPGPVILSRKLPTHMGSLEKPGGRACQVFQEGRWQSAGQNAEVAEEVQLRPVALETNRDQVEPDLLLLFLEEDPADLEDPLRLGRVQARLGPGRSAPAFHLHHHGAGAVPGQDVRLPAAHPEVRGDDPVASFLQDGPGE